MREAADFAAIDINRFLVLGSTRLSFRAQGEQCTTRSRRSTASPRVRSRRCQAKFRRKRRTAWSDPNRQGAAVDSFLEGPSFDRKGNLYCVDIPFGRIFRIDPRGEWELVVQYDGWPNGLKIHKDGRIFVCDYKRGLMVLDPKRGVIEPALETAFSEGFKGLNDLHFADNGDLYFTDQGQSGIGDPTGRVYRLRANGELQRLVDNAPSPNGITLNAKNSQVYVAVTRAQQIWRLPLMAGGTPSKTGVAIQLSGGHAGPDGIEMRRRRTASSSATSASASGASIRTACRRISFTPGSTTGS